MRESFHLVLIELDGFCRGFPIGNYKVESHQVALGDADFYLEMLVAGQQRDVVVMVVVDAQSGKSV